MDNFFAPRSNRSRQQVVSTDAVKRPLLLLSLAATLALMPVIGYAATPAQTPAATRPVQVAVAKPATATPVAPGVILKPDVLGALAKAIALDTLISRPILLPAKPAVARTAPAKESPALPDSGLKAMYVPVPRTEAYTPLQSYPRIEMPAPSTVSVSKTPITPVAAVTAKPAPIAASARPQPQPMKPIPAVSTKVTTKPAAASKTTEMAQPGGEAISLRKTSLNSIPAEQSGQNNSIQVEAKDPLTGKIINIDISSDDLAYNSSNGVYTVTGNVYIIIPQRGVEVLSDKATYNPKTSNVVAVGNVYIIQKGKVLLSGSSEFDLSNDFSVYHDLRTVTDSYNLVADYAERYKTYSILRNGRLIMGPRELEKIAKRFRSRGGLRFGVASTYAYYTAARRNQYLYTNSLGPGFNGLANLDETETINLGDVGTTSGPKILDKPISPHDVATADFSRQDSNYFLKVNTITVKRKPKAFDKITFDRTLFEYKDKPFLFYPGMQFGYHETDHSMYYIGQEYGYNQDYGGWLYSPGWDRQMFGGWLSLSPMLTYGGGIRLEDRERVDPKLGVGLLAHFRSPWNRSDFGYGSTMREFVGLGQQYLNLSGKTRVRASYNGFMSDGIFGSQRPRAGLEVSDFRLTPLWSNWRLRTFAGAGGFRDNFYPTRRGRFFVDPTSGDPTTAGRFEVQGQLTNGYPLLNIGNFAGVGVTAQTRMAYYTSGDFYGLYQAGPYVNTFVGPVFNQLTYLYTQSVGQTPFVFDTYFRGRNNVQSISAIDLGKRVTIGTLESFSLNRDNSRGDLVVDQKFFVTMGSKNIRFSLALDMLQKRTFFGIVVNPAGQVTTDFNTLRVYQPDYDPRAPMPNRSTIAPHYKAPRRAKKNLPASLPPVSETGTTKIPGSIEELNPPTITPETVTPEETTAPAASDAAPQTAPQIEGTPAPATPTQP